ncbi:hypothetical protein CY34DRAFT_430755 [Suillus luteus UH-Slu-Lm8-n1]|uniref:Uncharacterized protein n=1 Tax=Suillus luteus UH-Slu-Lm8-n1 TaxID=930992 RepID=A0A0D0BU12_9AGAM|nr:hypothetical protein CY34DRAFT_430755 [Suillus luteus UH-Slu-Lm8-n1]
MTTTATSMSSPMTRGPFEPLHSIVSGNESKTLLLTQKNHTIVTIVVQDSRSTHYDHPYPNTGPCGTVDGCPVYQWLVLHNAMYFNPPRVLPAIDMRRRLQYKSAGTQLLLVGVGRPQIRR